MIILILVEALTAQATCTRVLVGSGTAPSTPTWKLGTPGLWLSGCRGHLPKEAHDGNAAKLQLTWGRYSALQHRLWAAMGRCSKKGLKLTAPETITKSSNSETQQGN